VDIEVVIFLDALSPLYEVLDSALKLSPIVKLLGWDESNLEVRL